MRRRQRLLSAVTAILVSVGAPVAVTATTHVLHAPLAKGVYIRIPITATDVAAAPIEHPTSPGSVAHVDAVAAPIDQSGRSFAGDRGIRSVKADSFGDPFGAALPASNAGPCAHATTCMDFQLGLARWPKDKNGTAVINWKFNDAGRRNVRAPAGLLESAVSSAMSQWSHWDSNINFRYQGLTDAAFGAIGKDGSCADGTNVVTWDKFDPTIIAMAGICTDKTGRIVRDADLALNVTFHWENINGKPMSRHSIDIRSIVTHELGHWLGLLDLYSPDDIHQTMSGYSEYGETRKRTPSLGDIIGIQTAFPCGTGDSCPRTQIADD